MSLPEVDAPAPVVGLEYSPLVFRQEGDVPVLIVPRGRTFEELRDHVRARLPEQRDRIGESTLRLDLHDRPIVLFDLRRLISIFRDEFQIEVTGLYVRNDVVLKFAERELKLRLFVADPSEERTEEAANSPLSAPPLELTALASELPHLSAPPESEPSPDPTLEEETQEPKTQVPVLPELVVASAPAEHATAGVAVAAAPVSDGSRRTQVVQKTMRSGSSVKFDGDVTVMGDVNAGAEITAAGNILVMGALKGVAHAGGTGDETATIFAFDLKPTQLRIGRRIAITPPRSDTAKVEPEVARVQDEQIAIEPYRRR